MPLAYLWSIHISSCHVEHRNHTDWDLPFRKYLQTLDEILFTNIDVTGSVLAFLLLNLATASDFQTALRLEIQDHHILDPSRSPDLPTNTPSSSYLSAQNSLLHFATLESLRISPALGKSLGPLIRTAQARPSRVFVRHFPVFIHIILFDTDLTVAGCSGLLSCRAAQHP